MRNKLKFSLFLFLFIFPIILNAQKSYKVVCDKSDGIVKIVDNEDRSPNLIPLKGGFPFYQVAQNWVKENYPSGKCDPAAAIKQNQAAADALTQSAAGQKPSAPQQTQTSPGPTVTPGLPAGQTALPLRVPRYRNTSMFITFLFSDLGRVYNIDPPLIPGISAGIEQVIGTKLYGGTGITFNTLIGKTSDEAGVNAFYSFRIPLFAGYRMINNTRYWGVDLGLAANTMLRPLTSDSDLAGETASDVSYNTFTRARFGNERRAFELGAEVWLNELLSSEEGYQMIILTLGYRFYF